MIFLTYDSLYNIDENFFIGKSQVNIIKEKIIIDIIETNNYNIIKSSAFNYNFDYLGNIENNLLFLGSQNIIYIIDSKYMELTQIIQYKKYTLLKIIDNKILINISYDKDKIIIHKRKFNKDNGCFDNSEIIIKLIKENLSILFMRDNYESCFVFENRTEDKYIIYKLDLE